MRVSGRDPVLLSSSSERAYMSHVDLTTLPFHLQHEFDGGVYLSSAIDFTVDPATGKRNVGCRRLMLRGRREMRSNLTDASDLTGI